MFFLRYRSKAVSYKRRSSPLRRSVSQIEAHKNKAALVERREIKRKKSSPPHHLSQKGEAAGVVADDAVGLCAAVLAADTTDGGYCEGCCRWWEGVR